MEVVKEIVSPLQAPSFDYADVLNALAEDRAWGEAEFARLVKSEFYGFFKSSRRYMAYQDDMGPLSISILSIVIKDVFKDKKASARRLSNLAGRLICSILSFDDSPASLIGAVTTNIHLLEGPATFKFTVKQQWV